MKKLLCSAISILLLVAVHAQRQHFVYIESEQPFFVKLDEKTSSSGGAGYLILSQLADSTYNIRVGFPQNKFPDQLFELPIRSSDHGFTLKAMDDGGWGLMNLQTQGVIPATKGTSAFRWEPRNVSAFTEILARATDDPSLRFTSVRIVQEPPVVKEEVSIQQSPERKNEEPGVDSALISRRPDLITDIGYEPVD